MKNNPLPRLDSNPEIRERLLPFCRLQPGDIWEDPDGRHRIGCNDAADRDQIRELVADARPTLAIHDPPYNLVAFERRSIGVWDVTCSCTFSRSARPARSANRGLRGI
jgi:site-specific DNA-methyltransferase (adenine-specific)